MPSIYYDWRVAKNKLIQKAQEEAKRGITYAVRSSYVDTNGYSKEYDFIIKGISLKTWARADLVIGRRTVDEMKGVGYIPFTVFPYVEPEEIIEVETKTEWALSIIAAHPARHLFKYNWEAEIYGKSLEDSDEIKRTESNEKVKADA